MSARQPISAPIGHHGFEFDYSHNVIYYKGEGIHLTPHEADILQVLLNNRARTTPLEVLIQNVYGTTEPPSASVSIRVAVHSLRKKLRDTGLKIKAEPRVGYEIDAEAIPELNRRLSDKILIAINTAKASGEHDIVARLQAAYEMAETRRRRWLATRGGSPQNAIAQRQDVIKPTEPRDPPQDVIIPSEEE
jgi:DNA-binding winged helix-turn-helix (wHTH) protein